MPLGSLAALGQLASPGNPGALGPEAVPVPVAPSLAAAGSLQPGQTVDGVSCKPIEGVYTLGDLFDVWGRQLAPGVVASALGHVTAFVNERPYKGNPRRIPLFSHAQIQLDIGRSLVAPESIQFANGL